MRKAIKYFRLDYSSFTPLYQRIHISTKLQWLSLFLFLTMEDKILHENLTNLKVLLDCLTQQSPIKINKGTREPCLLQLYCQEQARGSQYSQSNGSVPFVTWFNCGDQSTIFSHNKQHHIREYSSGILIKWEAHRKLS